MPLAPPLSRYLPPEQLVRLRSMVFASPRVMDGAWAGQHASPRHGHSIEFHEHRPYMPGDALSSINWKAFGRGGKLLVKRFEHQCNMAVSLLVDASASMAYAGTDSIGPSKFDAAARLAAAIGFLALRQQDQVSLGLAQGGLRKVVPSAGGPSQLALLLQTLESLPPAGPADMAAAVRQMAALAPRRSLLIVLGDWMDEAEQEPGALLEALGRFVHRGGEAIVFHVLHPHELSLPAGETAWYIDSETGKQRRVNPAALGPAYALRMKRFLQACRTGCRLRGIPYRLAPAGADLYQALEDFLQSRAG